MISPELLATIEGPLFSLELGIVDSPKSFDEALFKTVGARKLAEQITSEAEERLVRDRALSLLDCEDNDERFRHPFDLAIAVYIRILDVVESSWVFDLSKLAAQRRNLWWSRAMAMRVLQEPHGETPPT